jgi:hypothetical protein
MDRSGYELGPQLPSFPSSREKFQARAVGAAGRDEPRGRRAQHELQHLPALDAHLKAPAFVMHCEHGAGFAAAAEVRDPRGGTGAGHLS